MPHFRREGHLVFPRLFKNMLVITFPSQLS